MTDRLRDLALKPGWIYEVIVCTFSDGTPHAAPAGVWTDDQQLLQLDLYGTSRTLARIRDGGRFAVDFPCDATALFQALYAPGELRFECPGDAEAPCLEGSCATVQLSLAGVPAYTDPTRVRGRVDGVRRRGELRLINRAEGLLLESLILATRLERLGRDATLATLAENRRVVAKVAPGSACEQAMDRLLEKLRDRS
ncbi:MAG: DUF447 domain-containing protein [Thermoleophilia bacterium]